MTAPAPASRPPAESALPAPPRLHPVPDTCLFLDFDGTLVEIAAAPDAIRVSPALPPLLERLDAALGGRLAIVSGRAIADLDRHLGPICVAVAGSHGGEFRKSGADRIEALADPVPEPVSNAMRALAARLGGLLVEAKPTGMAVHYRDRPDAAPALLETASDLAHEFGMTLKRGKMVAELVMPGADKGSAVERIMQLPGLAGTRPIFVGDDVTDEDAFRKVREHQGGGILVGEQRETAALWRLDSVGAVHGWLAEALDRDVRA